MAVEGKTEARGTTTIGPTILIKGKLKVDEELIVKGRIEAEISSTNALIIENSGVVKANIRVKSANIRGVLVGNITAEERVEIASDGRVVGDLLAPRIILSDGAAFRGSIDMQGFDEGRQSEIGGAPLPSTAALAEPALAAPPLAAPPDTEGSSAPGTLAEPALAAPPDTAGSSAPGTLPEPALAAPPKWRRRH